MATDPNPPHKDPKNAPGVPPKIVDEFTSLINMIGIDSDPKGGAHLAITALALAESSNWEWGIARAHGAIAVCYAQCGELEKAAEHYEIAIPLLERVDSGLALLSKNNYANLIWGTDPIRALSLHKSTYEEAVAVGNSPLMILRALLGLANDYDAIGNHERFIEYNLQALDLATKEQLLGVVAVCRSNLAEAFLLRNSLEEALEQCLKAIEINTSLGATRTVSIDKTTLSKIYRHMGVLSKAESEAREAIVIANKIGSGDSTAAVALAAVLELQEKFDEAIILLEQAAVAQRKSANRAELLLLGKMLMKRNPSRSRELFLEYLHIAEKSSNKFMISNAYLALSDLFVLEGQPSEALRYLRKHFEVRDEFFSEQSQRQLLAFRVEQEIDKHQAESRELRMMKSHLEEQLQTKMIQFASQTELLASFREDLRRIIRKIEVHDPAINELKAKLRELPEGVDWKEFQKQFQKVHPEFQFNLSKSYPELTDEEIQVCVLLRLKLKSPDIGKLLMLSERTVQNRRYRIRKKLGLKTEDDIARFLGKY